MDEEEGLEKFFFDGNSATVTPLKPKHPIQVHYASWFVFMTRANQRARKKERERESERVRERERHTHTKRHRETQRDTMT